MLWDEVFLDARKANCGKARGECHWRDAYRLENEFSGPADGLKVAGSVLDSAFSCLWSQIDVSGGDVNLVPVTRLGTFIESEKIHPLAIKMDIQGFEILALEGARKSMLIYHPVLLIGYNIKEGGPNTWKKLRDFVDETDYCLFAVTRIRKNGNCYAYTFKEYQAAELGNKDGKMLFLVPKTDRVWLDDFCAKNGE